MGDDAQPDVRTLLQVKVGEVTEADEIFSKLMGDVVEPRREFIRKTPSPSRIWMCEDDGACNGVVAAPAPFARLNSAIRYVGGMCCRIHPAN